MEIKKEINGNICTLSPVGRIDTLTSGELEEAVNKACAECEKLVLDMTEVDYVSSAGIRVIIQAHQTVGGLGKFIALNTADFFSYSYENGKNVLKLIKQRS